MFASATSSRTGRPGPQPEARGHGSRRRPPAGDRWVAARGTVARRADRRRHVDGVGHPRLPRPQGVWTKDPKAEKLSNLHYYMNDPEVRVASWQARLVHPAWTAQPNAGHLALAELERKGRLDTLVTQNIDGLHQKAGSSPERGIEIHGTVRDVVCMACGERAPMERALERVRAGEADP